LFFCRLGVGIIKFLFGGQGDSRVSTQSGFNLLTPISKVREICLFLTGEYTGHNNVHACNEKYEHDRE